MQAPHCWSGDFLLHFFLKVSRLIFFLSFISSFLCAPAFPKESFYQLSRRDFLFSCQFLDSKTGWIVGNKGLILKTIDGGGNWIKIETGMNNALNDITFVEKAGWIVGQGGVILNTSDGGETWERQKSNCDNSLMKLFFLDKQRGIAVGQNGTILLTEDGGEVWGPIQLDWTDHSTSLIDLGVVAPNLYDVFFVNETNGWVVGDNGTVLYTSNGGREWSLFRAGTYPALFSIFLKDDSEGWATGQNGVFLHTSDGGKIWEPVNIATGASLFKVRIVGNYGVLVGNGGTLFQTSDGGTTWNQIRLDLALPYPWFSDAGIVPTNSPAEVLLIGKGIVRKISLH